VASVAGSLLLLAGAVFASFLVLGQRKRRAAAEAAEKDNEQVRPPSPSTAVATSEAFHLHQSEIQGLNAQLCK
jgi:hypothetical protein